MSSTNTHSSGRHRLELSDGARAAIHRYRIRLVTLIAAVVALISVIFVFVVLGSENAKQTIRSPHRAEHAGLPTTPGSYLGVYATGVPMSYAGITAFTIATGVRPRLVVYYSGWFEPFQASFAASANTHGAVPLVQIDPTKISLTAIASGRYDTYLRSYAHAVRTYRNPVVLSFGHEMNGTWFSWGYRHASPTAFVAAWRHIVTLFRAVGTPNVTWLWTINIIKTQRGQISGPASWWPGNSYVTWVGIDGYYLKPSWRFAPMFGPTIVAVRQLTRDPILVAETSATPASSQPAKIADLFAGIHRYGLLGFIWFDDVASHDYRINGPAAIAAFRRGAKAYNRSPS